MIGETGVEEQPRAPELHPTFSSVWSVIARFGLSEEDSQLLASRNPVPSNCPFLEPPKVNPAVWELMDFQSRESDTRIVHKQRFIAAALAGIGATVSPYLIDSNEADLSLLQPLFDVARLLSAVFYGGSVLRRSMLIRLINPAFKETLEKAEFGEFLFGADLLERIRAAKALQQSAADLQKPQVSSSASVPPRRAHNPLSHGSPRLPAGASTRLFFCQQRRQ